MVKNIVAVMLVALMLGACAAEPNKARDPSGEGLGTDQGGGVTGSYSTAP